MKSDKLTLYHSKSLNLPIYVASKVDAAIAELNAAIAELKDENERLKAIRKVHVEAIASMEAGLQQDDKEIRHHKYRRCLAMAKWCRSRACFYDTMREGSLYWAWKSDRAYKWHKRWLELAEKFKEAK